MLSHHQYTAARPYDQALRDLRAFVATTARFHSLSAAGRVVAAAPVATVWIGTRRERIRLSRLVAHFDLRTRSLLPHQALRLASSNSHASSGHGPSESSLEAVANVRAVSAIWS